MQLNIQALNILYEAEDGFCIAPFGIQESLRFTVVANKRMFRGLGSAQSFLQQQLLPCVSEIQCAMLSLMSGSILIVRSGIGGTGSM